MKSVIWIVVTLGTLTGVISATGRDLSTMVVMGIVGAGFGAPVGATLSAMIMASRKSKWGNGCSVDMRRNESQQSDCTYSPMMATDEWMDYRQRFSFYAAGDTDPMAKTMTGWRDASDVHYARDIAS